MQATTQKIQKKYKKIILTGLHIPPPPPLLTTITTQLQQSAPTSKQQSIQKSSSSSEQQTSYENYFQNKLQSIIRELLGQDVQYQVMEMRESKVQEGDQDLGKKDGEDVVDVVLKVAVLEEKAGELKEKIGSMKKKNNEQLKQDSQQPKKTLKASPKKPKPKNSPTKKQKIPSNKKKSIPTTSTPPPSSSSSQQSNHDQDTTSRHLNFIEQTTHNLDDDENVSSINILNSQINRNDRNRENRIKSYEKNYGKKNGKQKQSSSEDQAASYDKGQRKRNKSNDSRQAKKKFKKFCTILVISLIALAVLASTILFLTRQIELQLEQIQKQQKLPQKPLTKLPNDNPKNQLIPTPTSSTTHINQRPYQGQIGQKYKKTTFSIPSQKRDETTKHQVTVQIIPTPTSSTTHINQRPYQGQIGQKYKKTTFSIPSQKKDETTKHQVTVQIIPAVNYPQNSLHPRNLSYIRPTYMKLLTFHQINIKDQYFRRSNKQKLNFTHSQVQIKKYLAGLGKNDEAIMQNLYTQLHKNQSSSLLLEAQYLYLSQKYQLPSAYMVEKPLCIVAYSQNLYQSNRFLPFFQSLFNQNYTKYRLVYIDNASKDEYNAIKIMNYLQSNFYQKLAIVGTSNIFFARLDKKLSKSVAKFSIVRELCGEGDIVIDIDGNSQFLGRQALGVISSVYDGANQRVMSLPKEQLDRFLNPMKYYKETSNLQTQDNLSANKKKQKNSLTGQKGPKMFQPQSQSQSQPPKTPQPQTKKDKIDIKVQQRVFVSRKVGLKWAAYTNYLYTDVIFDKSKDSQQINYKFVNSTEQITKMRAIVHKENNFEDVRDKLGKKYLSNVCLKTYVTPVQYKIPYTKFDQKIRGKTSYHESYLYDIELLMSVLEISGEFHKIQDKSMEVDHIEEIKQPLCYRSDVNIAQKCEEIKMLYEELHFIGRSQMSYILAEVDKYESFSKQIFNKKQENSAYLQYLEEIKAEMQKECGH